MIKLMSSPYTVVEIKKATKAKFYKDIKVGDLILFKMEMHSTKGASSGGIYASYVVVQNMTQGTRDSSKSQTETIGILSRCFELEELVGRLLS